MKASTEHPPITIGKLLRSSTTGQPRFPASLLERTEYRHAQEFSSGRAALYHALRNEGIRGTDEVLVPSYTDLAVDRIADRIATSVNVDVSAESFNLDLEHATELITERTAAIVPTHMFGRPMDMEAVRAFADDHDLVVIEDAAHALGTTFLSDAVGASSDYCMFSFRFSKDATVFTGGMLLSTDPLGPLEHQSPDRLSMVKLGSVITLISLLDRMPGEVYHPLRRYVLDPYFTRSAGAIGDLRLQRLSARERASLGYQYRTLPERIATRRDHAARYDEALPDSLPTPVATDSHGYWRYSLLFPPSYRDRVCRALQRRGIGCSTTYAYTVSPRGLCERADHVADSVVNLPVHSGLADEQLDYIIDAVIEIWENIPEAARGEGPLRR
jgi:dTDP-4-amino-4,6-dideoxygalactose transaminase